MTIDAQRTPDDRFNNLPGWPFAPQYVDDLSGFEGLRMHYVDEGPQDSEVTMLCVHGTPSWSYVYRKMIPVFVAQGHRTVALDMYGFGRSDKPKEDSDYGYHFHRNSLKAFVERLDLKNICLVAQDWGGILMMSLIMDMPERFTRMFLMNTSMPHGEEPTPGFNTWRKENRSKYDNPVGTWIGSRTPHLSDAEVYAYDAPFPDASFKGGVRRFPELIMRPEDGVFSEAAKEGLETSLTARKWLTEAWDGQCFMAMGMKDPVITPERMRQLHGIINGAYAPHEVENAGHYVQEWSEDFIETGLKQLGLWKG